MDVRALDLSSPIAFVVVAALGLIDGVFPLVPARTAVIGLGVLAGEGQLMAIPLVVVATVAAFLSDNLSYWIGARFWPRIKPVLFGGRRSGRMWGWVEHQMAVHGAKLVVLDRVLPGGPTPITLTAGLVGLDRRTFRLAAAGSAVLWSAYAFLVGMLGDTVVGHHPVLALLAALAVVGGVNLSLRLLIHPGTPAKTDGDVN